MERTKPAHVWPWVGLAALAGMTLALPLAWLRRRRHPPTREHEWMEAYVRGCLADFLSPSWIWWAACPSSWGT